jgi:hypothetical protein
LHKSAFPLERIAEMLYFVSSIDLEM